MPYVTSRGHRIFYNIEGKGPSLLLHHGFSGTHRRWQSANYVSALSRHYSVILMDALGHGASDKPHESDSYRVELQAADVISVLDHVGVDRVHYWGFSMGGRIGFAIADNSGNRLRSLIVGAAHPYSRTLIAAQRPDGSDPSAFVNALYKRTGSNLSELPSEIREDLFANDFRALSAVQQDWPPLESALSKIAVPTLFYVGSNDPYLEKVRRAAQAVKDCNLIVLEDLDHWTAFRDASRILPEVKDFLASVP